MHALPEPVVEIAFEGFQRSTRYPGGVALRFASLRAVIRYRGGKFPVGANKIDEVRAFSSLRPIG